MHKRFLSTDHPKYEDEDDEYSFRFGMEDDIPVTGDWDGDGVDEVGVFRPSTHKWFLVAKDPEKEDPAVAYSFYFGEEDDIPVGGDWDGDNSH
jgi:hypothetical protein